MDLPPWNHSDTFEGPFASMILADYGADVIKVEKPGRKSNENVAVRFHMEYLKVKEMIHEHGDHRTSKIRVLIF